MSYELGADGKYADLPLSNFPDSIDEFENKTAVNADNLAIANQYRGYLQNGNYGLAAQMREVYPELNRIIIDESTINKMQQTIQAVQRVFRDDVEKYVKNQVFEEDLMVWNYTHSYNSSTKVHNFTGKGVTGRAKITADYHSGDTFAVNGTAVSAYVGSEAPDGDTIANGRWVLFVVDGNTINFSAGGGLTRSKLALATAAESVVLNGYTFYSKGEKTLKVGNIQNKATESVTLNASMPSYSFGTSGRYCTGNMNVSTVTKDEDSVTITPSTSTQTHTFDTTGKMCTGNMSVTVNPVPGLDAWKIVSGQSIAGVRGTAYNAGSSSWQSVGWLDDQTFTFSGGPGYYAYNIISTTNNDGHQSCWAVLYDGNTAIKEGSFNIWEVRYFSQYPKIQGRAGGGGGGNAHVIKLT